MKRFSCIPLRFSARGGIVQPVQFPSIFVEHSFFDHPACGIVERMCRILEGAVLALLTRHGDKKACIPMNNLQVSNDKAIIKDDGRVALQTLLTHREHSHFRNLHGAHSLVRLLPCKMHPVKANLQSCFREYGSHGLADPSKFILPWRGKRATFPRPPLPRGAPRP